MVQKIKPKTCINVYGIKLTTCNCLTIAFTRSSTNFRTRILSASDLPVFNFDNYRSAYWVTSSVHG